MEQRDYPLPGNLQERLCAPDASGQRWFWPNKNAADMTRPRVKWRWCCRGVLSSWLTATPLRTLSRMHSPPAERG